jgi:hypothetical protein
MNEWAVSGRKILDPSGGMADTLQAIGGELFSAVGAFEVGRFALRTIAFRSALVVRYRLDRAARTDRHASIAILRQECGT